MAKTFPELTHTKHTPNGEAPHYVKRSEHTDAGHNDSGTRMTPFGEFPNSETGEGLGSPRPAGSPHPFNE